MEEENKKNREIDIDTKNIYSWLGSSYVLVRKKNVKTWQGVFLIAFFAGALAAIIWSVSLDIQPNSFAEGESASLSISPSSLNVSRGENFSLDVNMLSNGNVVASRAIIIYDTRDFSLTGWDTSGSVFAPGNTCIYENKPCEIIENDAANGRISIVLAKPSPGVTVSSGKIATLNFKAADEAQSDSIKIFFEGAGKYTDSDIILDGDGPNGSGSDILASVNNSMITIDIPVEEVTCTEFTYSEWGECLNNNKQYRTVVDALPEGCVGGDPILEQKCNKNRETIKK